MILDRLGVVLSLRLGMLTKRLGNELTSARVAVEQAVARRTQAMLETLPCAMQPPQRLPYGRRFDSEGQAGSHAVEAGAEVVVDGSADDFGGPLYKAELRVKVFDLYF